jgi:hypothetical protein
MSGSFLLEIHGELFPLRYFDDCLPIFPTSVPCRGAIAWRLEDVITFFSSFSLLLYVLVRLIAKI